MRKIALIVALLLGISLAGSASAQAANASGRPARTAAAATTTCDPTHVWEEYYGGTYGTRSVSSARNPEWHVYSNSPYCGQGAHLYFQPDGNLVCYHYSNGVVDYTEATGSNDTAPLLPMTLKFQSDGNIVIYDNYGEVRWFSDTWAPGATWYRISLAYTCAISIDYLKNGVTYHWFTPADLYPHLP